MQVRTSCTVPNVSIESPKVLDSTTALELPDVPNRLLVVGGGYIGLERVSLDDIARQAQPNPVHPQHGAHHHG